MRKLRQIISSYPDYREYGYGRFTSAKCSVLLNMRPAMTAARDPRAGHAPR